MIIDKRLEFCDATALAASAGTAVIGSQIDMEVVRDIGQGQPVYFVMNVDTEIITAGSAGTVRFELVSDASAALATDGSSSIHWASDLFVTDDANANATILNAGQQIACFALPAEGKVYERYLGVLCVSASNDITAGKVNAFLTLDPHGNKFYADASN